MLFRSSVASFGFCLFDLSWVDGSGLKSPIIDMFQLHPLLYFVRHIDDEFQSGVRKSVENTRSI